MVARFTADFAGRELALQSAPRPIVINVLHQLEVRAEMEAGLVQFLVILIMPGVQRQAILQRSRSICAGGSDWYKRQPPFDVQVPVLHVGRALDRVRLVRFVEFDADGGHGVFADEQRLFDDHILDRVVLVRIDRLEPAPARFRRSRRRGTECCPRIGGFPDTDTTAGPLEFPGRVAGLNSQAQQWMRIR